MLNNIRQIKDYKSPIQEILAASSLAYLLSPFRSKRLLIKIIWSLFLIIFLFLSIYYVILNILDYLQYNTTTSIYTINEQEIDFPTVSFCLKRDYYASENIFEIEIVALWFNNQNLLNEWSNHLESYQDLYYGQCYRYNSGLNMSNQSIPFKKLKASGRDDGLWLEFISKSSENTSKPIVLYIHNQTQMPATIYNKGRFISKGLNTYLIMKRIYDQKLESPYNDCFNNVSQYPFNKTIINYLSSKNREYTQKECFYLCRNLKFNELNYCNCTLPSLDHQIWSQCEVAFWSNCYNQFIDNYITNDLCSHYCPLECDSFSYETTVELELTNDLSTIDWYVIIVYLEDLKYTLISQQPKIELFGLISNLGGILGLFIGFSFISLLEIIETIAELIYIYFD